MSAQSGCLVLVHTHSQTHSKSGTKRAPPYLMVDKETGSRGWSLTRTRNPCNVRLVHNTADRQAVRGAKLPKARYYALLEPELGGNEHMDAAVPTTQRTNIETIRQTRGVGES